MEKRIESIRKNWNYAQDPINWTYFDEAKDLMDNTCWMDIEPKLKKADPLAFATRAGKNGTSGVYEVYVNANVVPGAVKPLKLHEFGHVIFSHLQMSEAQRNIAINKIITYWPLIKNHIDMGDQVLSQVEELARAKKVASNMAHIFMNIAMDFEVNSKLFTPDEWANFKLLTNDSYLNANLAANPSEEFIAKIEELIAKGDQNSLTKPCWPEDYEFPIGLSYTEYLDLMLMNIDKFMDNMKNNQQGEGGEGDEEGQGEEGEGDGQGSGKGGKLTLDDIEKMKEQYSDTNNEENQKAVEEANAEEAASNGDGQNEGGEPSKGKSTGGKRGEPGYSPVGHKEADAEVVIGARNKKIEDFLLRECFNKKIIHNNVDNMYYYNRKKYDNNVMIGKDTSDNVYRPGNIYLVVDCSGSINHSAINAFIATVKKIAQKCGPKSRIIWWDTRLSADTLLRKNEGPKSSGGTDIAEGIKYVRENYLKSSNDKLVVISDYEDNMIDWAEELEKVSQDAVGICWSQRSIRQGMKPSEIFAQASYIDYSSRADSTKIFRKLYKKLPTVFVDISND